ncbi:MAG: metallophosphoesterase family protein [Coriobacteriia bacterium]|nr:metallophosphoesterase family protein [Coriobacteriia bacterium]
MSLKIGLISDTHGKLDSRVSEIFSQQKLEAILHAGDIGPVDILVALEEIAPVFAVRGNNDHGFLAWPLDSVFTKLFAGKRITLVHDFKRITPDRSMDALICGHTHIPMVVREPRSGVLVINPGSASAPRSPRGPSVGILTIDGTREKDPLKVEIIYLDKVPQ